VRKKAEPSTDGCSIGKKEMRRVVPGCNATAFGGAFLGKTPLAASKNHLGLNKAVQKKDNPHKPFTRWEFHRLLWTLAHLYPSTQWIRKV